MNYPNQSSVEVTVVKGRRYLWTPGESESALVNDDGLGNVETLSEAGTFVARSSLVVATVIPLAVVTATLQPQTGWTRHQGGLTVKDWVKHPFIGARRLFFVGADGFMNLYEETPEDMAADQYDALAPREIEDEITSRGYTCNQTGRKRYHRAQLNFATWDPSFTVNVVFDGVNEITAALADQTKSRTEYYQPFDAEPYDITNVNDDHDTPQRQNYSVEYPDEPADLLDFDNEGIDFDLMQEHTERLRLRGTGTYCQMQVRNTQGRLAVQNIMVEAVPGQRRMGVQT